MELLVGLFVCLLLCVAMIDLTPKPVKIKRPAQAKPQVRRDLPSMKYLEDM
jgi:hypothetical protein